MTAAASHPFLAVLEAAGLYTPNGHAVTVDLSDLPAAAAGDPAAAHYAEKALEYEADAVAASTEGTRNDNLNRACFKIGSLVAAGHLDAQHAIDTLIAAARVSGLPASEINHVVYRATREGGAEPRVVKLEPVKGYRPAYTLDGPPPAPPGAAGVSTSGAVDTGATDTVALNTAYPPLDWRETWSRTPEDVDWLAYPVLERGGMYALYSPAKAGKSLFALDLCAAIAAGRSALGQPPAAPATVLYVDLENHVTDIVGRLKDMGYQPSELDRLIYLSFPALPALDTRVGGAQLFAEATRHRAEMVVIDTVSRVISGEENSADTFNALYRYSCVPLKAAGITVLRLDHAGKDEDRGMRGSSAKISDVDVAWKLTRTSESRVRLDRIACRNAHHPDSVILDQHDMPLRHVLLPGSGLPDRVAQIVRTLDRLAVPADWGRDRVRHMLAERGIKVRNDALGEALRVRRTTFTGGA
ncbi:AAA domain-containing protein [Amycolatopsis pretoriensis]|uniref:AAA domain-containing protein n=1 Tax=Amycolatopsis pretoriensis TaxID=218821 RepID=A0A1H5R7G5_9PSEU|nr:AAA family ATPase [Amycolatopsis pretoriensis]SEF34360.1 AAA domain-containing protein [Amycolatopsis pretoriensis]